MRADLAAVKFTHFSFPVANRYGERTIEVTMSRFTIDADLGKPLAERGSNLAAFHGNASAQLAIGKAQLEVFDEVV